MPNIKLSKNYQAILSARGKHIMKGLIEISCDERFWKDSSSEEIVERTLDVLGSKRGEELAPKGCTSHTHRKVEGFLLASLVREVFSYYHSTKVRKAYSDIRYKMPMWCHTRHLDSIEIEEHIESNKNQPWWK